METGSCNELWHLQVSEVSVCYGGAKSSRFLRTNNQQMFWNDGPTVQELLQTVQGNGNCSWNSLSRTVFCTEISDRLVSSKLSVLHRAYSAIVQQGMYPYPFDRYLSQSSLHSCEDFFAFEYLKPFLLVKVVSLVYPDKQRSGSEQKYVAADFILYESEKLRLRNYTFSSGIQKDVKMLIWLRRY